MKLRIKIPKHRLSSIFLMYYCVIIIELRFFFLIPYTGIFTELCGNGNQYLALLFTLLGLLLLYRYVGFFFGEHKKFGEYLLCVFFVLVIVSLFSMAKYNESIIDTFTCWHHYILIMLVIPLYYICKREGSIEFLCNTVIISSVVFCLITIIQGIIYNNNHILFLPGYFGNSITYRRGNIRMDANNMDILAFVFLCSKLFAGNLTSIKTKIGCIFGIFIELITQLFFCQTRTWQIIYIAVLALMYIISTNNKKIIRVGITILCFLFFFQLFDVASFIDSFSVDAAAGTGLSTSNRIAALEYFWGVIKHNPLFGNGFIRASRPDLRSILYGPYELYYYTDLGVFGLLAESGMIGSLIFLLPFFWIINKAKKVKASRIYTNQERSIIYGILLIWIFTSANLALTNSSRYILIPFSLAIIEFIVDSKNMK